MLDKEKIKELALTNGFKLKEQPDGTMGLNPYVFEFAAALERVATAELKAQVEQLKQFGAELLNQCEGLGKSNAIWRATGLAFGNIHYQDAAENLAACINKTPAKCLAENNVQVLESFDAFIEMTFPQEGVNFDTYLAALDMFREQLRQQAKAGK